MLPLSICEPVFLPMRTGLKSGMMRSQNRDEEVAAFGNQRGEKGGAMFEPILAGFLARERMRELQLEAEKYQRFRAVKGSRKLHLRHRWWRQ